MEKLTEEEYNILKDAIEKAAREALAKEYRYIQNSESEFREIWKLYTTD